MNKFIKDQIKDIKNFFNQLRLKDSLYWKKRGQHMALNLFKEMSEKVPAYKKFLKENKINPKNIKTFSDLKKVPALNKDNYLKKYSFKELCWDGSFKNKSWVISSTSGSTGQSLYFPRGKEQDLIYSITAELYLLSNFNIDKKSTLYINAFPMGPWIGGVFTYQAIRYLAERGNYNISMITTSIDKEEIIKSVKKFGKEFDQIIIGSYAPFLKDVLEEGKIEGIKWSDYDINFIFSAEGFSEDFRDYVLETINRKGEILRTLNHYGTVDLGTMAHETPLSIKIRRELLKNKDHFKNFFGFENKTPTFCQFLPEHFYFENNEDTGELMCSSFSGIPLFKYNLKDNGMVVDYNDTISYLNKNKISIKDRNIPQKSIWKLPFVYVFERNDFSVSFYGFQIYPETIKKSLLNNDLNGKITGKFVMLVDFDKKNDQKLYIHLELAKNKNIDNFTRKIVQKLIINNLLLESSEFKKTYKEKSNKIKPIIIFHKYEDPKFFKTGIKQKWVIKK